MLLKRAVLVSVAGVIVLGYGADSRASSTLIYDATADASAQHVLVDMPGAPLSSSLVDVGGSRAVARVTSLGLSTARAATPHPGDLAISAPGVAGALLPLPVALPPYPLVADSSYPSAQSTDASQGPVILKATSDQHKSTAQADLTAPAGAASAVSDTVITASDTTVVSTATTSIHSVVVGPLSIESLSSTAKVTRTAAGLVRSSSLTASGVSVAGTPLRIDSSGITVAGTTLKLDQVGALTQALQNAGVTVTYVASKQTANGVVAPNLMITTTQPVPPNPALSVSTATYTIVLGEASAEISGQAFADQQGPPSPSVAPDTSAPVPPVVTGGGPIAEPETSTQVLPSLPGMTEPPVPAPVIQPVQPTTAAPALLARAMVSPVAWSTSFYLALAGAALLIVLVLTLVRYLGVRYP